MGWTGASARDTLCPAFCCLPDPAGRATLLLPLRPMHASPGCAGSLLCRRAACTTEAWADRCLEPVPGFRGPGRWIRPLTSCRHCICLPATHG